MMLKEREEKLKHHSRIDYQIAKIHEENEEINKLTHLTKENRDRMIKENQDRIASLLKQRRR